MRNRRNAPRCIRPGCRRHADDQHDTCSVICSHLMRQTRECERIASALGGPAADNIRNAAEDFTAAFDDLIQLRRNVRLQALAAGMTPEQWSATIRGAQHED